MKSLFYVAMEIFDKRNVYKTHQIWILQNITENIIKSEIFLRFVFDLLKTFSEFSMHENAFSK